MSWCTGCFTERTVLLEPQRPPAMMRSELHTASARDLVKRSWNTVESKREPNVLIGVGGMLALFGPPGCGKSTWLMSYLDGVAGPVVLLSAEERLGPTVSSRLSRLGVNRADFHLIGQGSMDSLVAFCRRVRAVVLAVDSINVTTFLSTDLRRLVESTGVKALVFALQSTKDGKHAGSQSYLHESDVVMEMSEQQWVITKSRYQATPITGSVLMTRTEEVVV